MSLQPLTKVNVFNWLKREQVLAHMAVALVLCGVIWFFLFQPRIGEIRRMKKQLSEKESSLIETEGAIKRIKNIDRLVVSRREELAALEQHILRPGDEATMIQVFTQATGDLPVTVLDVQPYVPPAGDLRGSKKPKPWEQQGFQKTILEIHLQCRYQTLGLLFERLGESPLVFSVEAFDLNTAELLAPSLDVHLVLATYMETG